MTGFDDRCNGREDDEVGDVDNMQFQLVPWPNKDPS